MSGNFSTGLFDCFSDMPICCIGMEMAPCLVGDTQSRVTGQGGCGRCCCYGVLSMFGLCAFAGYPVRLQLREKYGIAEGTGDCCLHCFCAPCAVCQEAREVKTRMAQSQFVPGAAMGAPIQQPPIKY